jgi:hypothetical protein
LPEEEIMQDPNESNQELAAEAFEKSKSMMSFAVTLDLRKSASFPSLLGES